MKLAGKRCSSFRHEQEITWILQLLHDMREDAIKAFNAGHLGGFAAQDALLHVEEAIEGELGYWLEEDGDAN